MPIVKFFVHGEERSIAYAEVDFDYTVDPRALIQAFYGDADLSKEELVAMYKSIVVEPDSG